MNNKIKYLIIGMVGMLILLEFCVFPSLSTQIKTGNIIYSDLIKEYNYKILDSVKIQQNVFIGNWRSGSGAYFVFSDGGSGTITYDVLIDYTAEKPISYEYDENIITITHIGVISEKLIIDTYNYKLDGNILTLEHVENGEISYLIKQ